MNTLTSAARPGAGGRAGVWLAILTLLAVLVPIGGAGATEDTARVNVYFTAAGSECDVTNAFPRDVEKPAVLTGALNALLAGPTDEEAPLVATMFSSDTAGLLRSVVIRDGVAHIDFADLRTVIPNASSSCGSTALLAQLDATATQFPTVDVARYSINGSEETFYEWLGYGVPDDGSARGTIGTLANRAPIRRADGTGPTLLKVRVGRHDGFDRVVFEFAGGIPSYHVRYTAVPLAGGSGQPIAVGGNTALQIDMGARTVDMEDPAFPRTFSPATLKPRFPTMRTVRYGGEFEGQATFGVGLRGRTGFRAIELDAPSRLVVDVAHGARVRTLRLGDRGVDVRDWKVQLNTVQHGFFASSTRPVIDPLPTGRHFGRGARHATRVLQRAEGATVTGTVNAETRRAMRRALYRSSQVQP